MLHTYATQSSYHRESDSTFSHITHHISITLLSRKDISFTGKYWTWFSLSWVNVPTKSNERKWERCPVYHVPQDIFYLILLGSSPPIFERTEGEKVAESYYQHVLKNFRIKTLLFRSIKNKKKPHRWSSIPGVACGEVDSSHCVSVIKKTEHALFSSLLPVPAGCNSATWEMKVPPLTAHGSPCKMKLIILLHLFPEGVLGWQSTNV